MTEGFHQEVGRLFSQSQSLITLGTVGVPVLRESHPAHAVENTRGWAPHPSKKGERRACACAWSSYVQPSNGYLPNPEA